MTIGRDADGRDDFSRIARRARTFHPNGKDEKIAVGRVMATGECALGRQSPDRLGVYKADAGRELHYAYSLNTNPMQLIVDVEFVERGGGDKVRPYKPAAVIDTRATGKFAAPPVARRIRAHSPHPSALVRRFGGHANQRPDAALKGLTRSFGWWRT